MSDADHRSSADQKAKYYLIFLHSIPERPLSREVVDLHAAHLAELDDAASSSWRARSWSVRAD